MAFHVVWCVATPPWGFNGNLIGATTTASGLRVKARLDTRRYPLGVAVSDEELEAVNMARQRFHGDWNYTIRKLPKSPPLVGEPSGRFERV